MKTTSVTVIRVEISFFREGGRGDEAEQKCRPPLLVDGKELKETLTKTT